MPPFLGLDYLEELAEMNSDNDTGSEVQSYNADLTNEREWLVVGPAGSGSRFHTDPYATSAWNVLTQGKKLWVMSEIDAPPGVCISNAANEEISEDQFKFVDAPPALEWLEGFVGSHPNVTCNDKYEHMALKVGSSPQQLLWAWQDEGDIVVVPHNVWHCVLNVEDCVAYTKNFINRFNIRQAIEVEMLFFSACSSVH